MNNEKYHIPSENRLIATMPLIKEWAHPVRLSRIPKDYQLEPLGAFIIQMAPKPETTAGQIAEPSNVVTHENGVSTRGWNVRDLTAQEVTEKSDGLKAALADYRWQKEVGGIVLPNGTPVVTDRHTQQKLTSAVVNLSIDPNMTLRWKNGQGQWIGLVGQEILTIALPAAKHVATCFTVEEIVSQAIDASVDINSFDLETEFDAAYAAAMQPSN